MNTLRLMTGVLFATALQSVTAFAQIPNTFYIFKITATIPVAIKTDGVAPTFVDKVTTRTLTTNDIINLALGQPLTTTAKANANFFLAMSLTFDPAGTSVLSKMIVCDKSQTGPALVKTVVATLDSLDYDAAYLGARRKGSGVGVGKFKLTTLGDPSKWAILASSFSGSGLSSGPLQNPHFTPPLVSPVATATIQGRFNFRDTDKNGVTKDYSGIVTRAAFRLNGKILGTYDE